MRASALYLKVIATMVAARNEGNPASGTRYGGHPFQTAATEPEGRTEERRDSKASPTWNKKEKICFKVWG